MKNKLINIDPEIMGGTPVFAGTRVPVISLFQHLEAGDSLEGFLDGFPGVKKEQAIRVIEMAKNILITNFQFINENLARRENRQEIEA